MPGEDVSLHRLVVEVDGWTVELEQSIDQPGLVVVAEPVHDELPASEVRRFAMALLGGIEVGEEGPAAPGATAGRLSTRSHTVHMWLERHWRPTPG